MADRRITKVLLGLALLLFLTVSVCTKARAHERAGTVTGSEEEQQQYSLLEDLELSEIDEVMDELFEEDFSFSKLVMSLADGTVELNKTTVIELFLKTVAGTFQKSRGAMLSILLLGILSAVFANISDAFETKGSAQVSFYIISLLLAGILLRAMREVSQLGSGVLADLTLFMQTLIPTFIATTAFVSGEGSAAAFYASSLLAIWIVETVLAQVVLPLAELYILMNFVNHLLQEDMLLQLMELIKSVVLFLLKAVLGIIIGIQTIQGLLAPALHTLKASAIHRAVSSIPGIGGGINVVTQTVISSAIVVKNSIGAAGMIFLALLSVSPVLELLAITAMYKITAAMIGILSEKKLSACVSNMGEGIKLIMKTVVTAMVLFMISIALLAAFTNRGL